MEARAELIGNKKPIRNLIAIFLIKTPASVIGKLI